MDPITTTIDGTRRATGLGTTKIYELINEGKLRTIKVGRRTLVYTASIRELLGAEIKAAA
jgi:excisionase family DNA binding protein